MKKLIILIVLTIVIILVIGGWFLFSKKSAENKENKIAQDDSLSFGEQIFEKVGENPAAKMPETNPFGKDINPYKGTYTNPFE